MTPRKFYGITISILEVFQDEEAIKKFKKEWRYIYEVGSYDV